MGWSRKKQAYENHVRMWSLLHERYREGNINYSRGAVLDELGETRDIWADCYGCQYLVDIGKNPQNGNNCKRYCPIVWPSGLCITSKIYHQWLNARTRLSAMRAAAMIRDLPMRK